ncbi:hypothetical protein IMG5_049400 [Ichthyophthirius multifiliis]|uniref:CAP-Gly domain-containing protein n=1 Tax=Ichthyophthirius multifiliis TaxID=5932 RepID=G0QMJ8_ICHMU|nr:hypothetical protein IMG5_049400 [Ichthyophthirius multifiliis]EGR33564.1 hypothetical protein IMG5_049400 [Ichthyophthirius multifiliis]|eukprot:XP_004037550.1 hypothetical protein IMG5_049400 [Ichthyophthirius multifiliis]
MQQIQFKVGDYVQLTNTQNKDQEGYIKFIGQLEGKEGIWVGVELTIQKGTHNGTFQDKKYFECKELHGIFVREKHLKLYQPPVQKSEEKQVNQQITSSQLIQSTNESVRVQQLKEELERKEDDLSDLTQTIQKLQQKLDKEESLRLLQTKDLEKKCEELQQKLYQTSQNQHEKQVQEIIKFQEEIQELKQALEEQSEISNSTESLVEKLLIQKEQLEQKYENLQQENEILLQENKKLKDNQLQADLALEEAMQAHDFPGSGSDEQFCKINARLRQAVQLLNEELELEKIESLEKIIELKNQLEQMPQLRNTIAEQERKIGTLSLQINALNNEIADLKEQLEINQESVNLIEKITEQNQKMEENIIEYRRQIKELKEYQKINQDLLQNYEENEKDMQNDLNSFEFQIYELKRILEEKEEQIQELQNLNFKIREKANFYKQQQVEAQQEISTTGEENPKKAAAYQKLLETNQELLQEKREMISNNLSKKISNNTNSFNERSDYSSIKDLTSNDQFTKLANFIFLINQPSADPERKKILLQIKSSSDDDVDMDYDSDDLIDITKKKDKIEEEEEDEESCSSNNESEEIETLNVEIEFKDANEDMFHSIKAFMSKYLDGISNNSSEYADILIKQILLGTFMVMDDEEDKQKVKTLSIIF